ncbi:hypothetical protein LJC35_00125 [Parabacteroides sp. OttesenSCG-928-N08]|nr:hypothetical protein [Parabacteroides sp. OttesenSCG-928-N08]
MDSDTCRIKQGKTTDDKYRKGGEWVVKHGVYFKEIYIHRIQYLTLFEAQR